MTELTILSVLVVSGCVTMVYFITHAYEAMAQVLNATIYDLSAKVKANTVNEYQGLTDPPQISDYVNEEATEKTEITNFTDIPDDFTPDKG